MKILVVHHSADYDGLFSGAVAYHFLTKDPANEVEIEGWDFGDEPLLVSQDIERIYVLDLPPDCLGAYAIRPGYPHCPVVWIDHHKSSIEKWEDELKLPGFRLDGVAACRLAWQYFNDNTPSLESFIDRRVDEPYALTLAGEYDVWDKLDVNADRFQFGLTANRYRDAWQLQPLLDRGGDASTEELCKEGEAAMKWQQAFAADVCETRGYMVEFYGLKFWCLASAHTRNSMWFPQEAVPKEADALMCYRIPGNGTISVSLYHKPEREDLDLSEIAKANGGGGHRGACGFSMTTGQAIVAGVLK